MKPEQRIVQLMSGVVITLAMLAACRKEVPPLNPTPAPDRLPKPMTSQAAVALAFISPADG